MRSKATSERYSSFKAAVQSCSASKLLRSAAKLAPRELFPKAASQSCFLKLFPKVIVFQSNCPSMLLSKPQSCSPQLLPKAALQNCYRKPRPKEAPQNSNVVARSCLKAGPESCPKLLPKLFPGAAPQSCAPKLFSKPVALKLRFCKPVHQNGSPKPFCKAAPESCASKLLPKAAVQSYCPKPANLQTYTPKRLPKAILQSGSRKLLPKVATESCSPELFVKPPPKAAVLQSNCS